MATVLICDDEAPLRELMRLALEENHLVVEAAEADGALALALEVVPDLVLLDLMLPGTSGIEVLRRIRGEPALAGIRVVVVSAWDAEADRRAVEEIGADAFVAKPFLPEELGELVERLLAPRAA